MAILDYKTACAIATSIVHSKLDYCDSLFYSIDSCQVKHLQTIQNAFACAVTKTPKHHHSSHNFCPKITALAKRPSTHPLQNCYLLLIVLFKPLNLLTYANYSPPNRPGLLAHQYISFSISASSFILSEVLQPLHSLIVIIKSSFNITPLT